MALPFSFSGHETFPLRVSWLKKAVEAVHDDSDIFRSDEAIAEFGVGKNMVRSIRHWGIATGVLKAHPTVRYEYAVDDFGEYLFGEEGKDQFCEDPATLWLLHWKLCCKPEHSTLWYYVFGHWRSNTLELGTLQPALRRWLEDQDALVPSASTLKRDFQCLVNTYVPPRRSKNRYAVDDFGEYLFGEEGKDQFCEDPATLWLLHWKLCCKPEHSTLWYYVFGHWRSNTLELGTLQPALRRWLEDQDALVPSASTLKRDFQCLVNTYVPPRRSKNLEDSLGCPLSSLGLIQEKDGLHYLQERHQTRLPPEIFAYGVFEYWNRVAPGRDSLSIEDTLNKNASPGRIFVLSEDRAFELISQVSRMEHPPFEYQDSAGVRQLVRAHKDVDEQMMLDQYYSKAARTQHLMEVAP